MFGGFTRKYVGRMNKFREISYLTSKRYEWMYDIFVKKVGFWGFLGYLWLHANRNHHADITEMIPLDYIQPRECSWKDAEKHL